jgi:hypothetical protein
MNFEHHKLILETVNGLREKGSWTGKTHVIKTLFLVSCKIELPFDFLLYKHGPYSFDIDLELEEMKSYLAVVSEQVLGYGPRLKIGKGKSFVEGGIVDRPIVDAIRKACQFVGDSNVGQLEALATAAWIRSRENLVNQPKVVDRLIELKPHVSRDTALWADSQVSRNWLH